MLRESRPADVHGVRRWDVAAQDAVALYVDTHAEEHIRHGFCAERRGEAARIDSVLVDLLLDTPQDDLVFAGARSVGVETLSMAATEAEVNGDWWRAACEWALVRRLRLSVEGPAGVTEPIRRTLDALEQLEQLHDGPMPAKLCESVLHIRFEQFISLSITLGMPELAARRPQIEHFLESNIVFRNPCDAAVLKNLAVGFIDHFGSGDNIRLGSFLFDTTKELLLASRTNLDPTMRYKCLMQAFNQVRT
eukprot:SAG11_NODE_6079_length_1392_cov_1.190255_2_plen_249_part_00